ncbi:MAG: T9SS C-terminal target domain-containing protein [Bacteroidetes bacterium]|nr:MAG: T9SS C-terminal target domain-containing protein [Bacteroidota bacterium]
MKKIRLIIALFYITHQASAQFTAGNVAVLRVGDSVTTLSNTGANLAIDQFTLTGAYVNTTFIPRGAATNAVCLSGTATSEGMLNLSGNGNALVFGAYRTAAPYISSVSATTSAVVNRTIVSVNAAGTTSLPTLTASFLSTNNIRYAYTNNGTNFWAGGGNTGIVYGSTTSNLDTVVSNTTANTRFITAAGGQLYYSTASGGTGIYRVGNGLPTNSGVVSTLYIPSTGGSPYCFSMKWDSTVCYVADDRAPVAGGGIQKWTRTGSVWSLAYTFGTGIGSTVGARGLAVNWTTTPPTIVATTAEGTINRVIRIFDSSATSSVVTIATAASNTIFRGVAFTPGTNVVPVKLTSFIGKAAQYGNSLHWITASELNNAGFEIERSIDGENFEQIAFVKGNGTTALVSKYQYIDYGSSNAYYRLKQVDYDGAFEYSNVIKVGEDVALQVAVSPNPFIDVMNVNSNELIESIEVMDVTGKVYFTAKPNALNYNLALDNIHTGVYFVRITSGGKTTNKWVVKQ